MFVKICFIADTQWVIATLIPALHLDIKLLRQNRLYNQLWPYLDSAGSVSPFDPTRICSFYSVNRFRCISIACGFSIQALSKSNGLGRERGFLRERLSVSPARRLLRQNRKHAWLTAWDILIKVSVQSNPLTYVLWGQLREACKTNFR